MGRRRKGPWCWLPVWHSANHVPSTPSPAGLSGRAVTTERVPPMPGERDLFGAVGTGDLADERLADAADDDPGSRLDRERRPLLRAGTGAGAPAGGGVLGEQVEREAVLVGHDRRCWPGRPSARWTRGRTT